VRTTEEIIAAKRDGAVHTREELEQLVDGFVDGSIPDYQMSAWLMAAYLNGLDHSETVWLTRAMAHSGRMLDLSAVPGITVDKHSTGGVADTTTLVVAPLTAACGVPFAKMSGRGLGHTGGTLDKLEAIPGMRVDLTPEELVGQVRRIGVAVAAQSPDVCPADKLIYALRDVTATVPSIPLIVASILSKKIAGGADAILLDVKVGSGAFMKCEEDAAALARALVSVGRELGREVDCVVSDMDQPLGVAVGNALEVTQAIRTLAGEGPPDLTELCLALCARLLLMGGAAPTESEGRRLAAAAVSNGAASEKFREWVEAQGGDGRIVDDADLLPRAPLRLDVLSSATGLVVGFDTEAVGRGAMLAGAGRAALGDAIDPSAGIVLKVRRGERIHEGGVLATVHASTRERLDAAAERVHGAVRVGDVLADAPPLVHATPGR
jgi:pyrimidine-nucleoside phosphorylase